MNTHALPEFFGMSLSSPSKKAPYVLVNPDGSVRMNLDNAETREKFRAGVNSIKNIRPVALGQHRQAKTR